MWLSFNKLLLLASVASTTSASPSFVQRDGVDYTVYNHAATGSKLEIIKNSAICETTPGVNQYSGYFSVGQNMSMWFWFFESRNNPKTAPLAAYFEGGPGCSSMLGLFQQNGPCHFVNNETTPSLNEYSWNNYANMLYVDQPIGSGFSYGDTDAVNSTATASPYVWTFLQVFYENFPEYESREFGLTTESYGGHYGPDFVDYIQQQNDKIDKGTVKGEKIDLVALMINNGWYDSAIQSKAYVDYAYDNPYRQLINESERDSYYNAYYAECLPALNACQIKGTDTACKGASSVCAAAMFNKMIAKQDFGVYDVRAPFNDPNPPATYAMYLQDATIQKAIGARVKYSLCSAAVDSAFSSTGDNSRSTLATLSKVVQSGINVLVWAGDADWMCNWVGGYAVANNVTFSGQDDFRSKTLEPYTVNGTQKGTFKNVDNLSFLRVFEAGHETSFYQPETALQAFTQIMQKKSIYST